MADISLIGVKKDIEMKQGDNVLIVFELANSAGAVLDMTGYDLRLQVRSSVSATSTLINCTIANGKLAWVTQATGRFKLVLTPADTSSLRFTADSPDVIEALYDMEVIAPTADPGTQKPWYGAFSIFREITR